MGKVSLDGLVKNAERVKQQAKAVDPEVSFRHVQARLLKEDAIRFKRAAEDHGLKQHDAVVEGINRLMELWGEPPVANIGANKSLQS